MMLSEGCVKRTRRVTHAGGMVYQMAVNVGDEVVYASITCSRLERYNLPPDYIDRELQGQIMATISNALFPRP